jgi:hypothetical protein
MTTDQIQTKLYEKADDATKAAVNETLKPVSNWISQHSAGARKIALTISSGAFVALDGSPIKIEGDIDVLRQRLERGSAKFTMYSVLEALRVAMFSTLQGPERVRFVDEFISDVQRLKDDVEDLQSRVE